MSLPTQPLISVDVVAFRRRPLGGVQAGLVRRSDDPFRGQLALPGVLLSSGETVVRAARRALSVKAGLGGPEAYLRQFGVFDGAARDPRGATLSVAFFAVADPAGALWEDVSVQRQIPQRLPFDHSTILDSATQALTQTMWRDVELTRALLGPTFTSTQVLALEPSLGLPTGRSNLSRWLAANGAAPSVNQSGLSRRDRRWEWES